jgi:hypothetical protein
MQMTMGVLADAANVTADGRMNILGIFGEIRSAAFTAVHPSAVLIVQLRAKQWEVGQNARVVIRLMDLDKPLLEISGEFVIPGNRESDATINQLFGLKMLQLPAPGEYAFHVEVNGVEVGTVPFTAIVV